MIEADFFIRTIDEFLDSLGTSSLVDARKVRDHLLDLRLMFMQSLEVPDTIESIIPAGEIL